MTRREIASLEDDCLELAYDVDYAGTPLSNDADKPAADGALILRLDCMRWMQEAAYPVENIMDVHTNVSVKHDDEDSAHVVCRIETLSRPLPEADAAADNYEFWACSCPGFHYHRFPKFDEGESIEAVGECTHIEAVRRSRREVAGEGQAQLGGVGDD